MIFKLLPDCIKDLFPLTLDGAFSALANRLESNQHFPTQELYDFPIDFSRNQYQIATVLT
jgi:hypothetical protein